jgi:hypothetical protein
VAAVGLLRGAYPRSAHKMDAQLVGVNSCTVCQLHVSVYMCNLLPSFFHIYRPCH